MKKPLSELVEALEIPNMDLLPESKYWAAGMIAKEAQLEILNWVMKLCGHGMTVGMIRKLVHNKHVEISGEGEKA